MKRLAYNVLAIFCFVVVSCNNEVPMPDYGEDYIVLNVINSPMTMAEGNPNSDYERQLNRLDCFFYVKDKTNEPCVYYHKAEVNDLGSATIPFYVNDLVLKEIFPSGSLCDVFVIANIPGDPTFEAKTDGTTMQALGEHLLDMTKGEYDGIGKPFVMTGSARVQKGQNSNASATISLARVASKVTMKVKVPKSIEVGSEENKVTMLPILKDNEGNEPLKTSFHYGTSKSYLSGAYHDDPANYINTKKIPYTLSEETDTHYVFTCDMPFYTYAREWDKGSDNAAYVTFEMPWGKDEDSNGVADEYKTYYYQILINGKDRNFVPNTHYDMTVTVGVLGSTVESLPKELAELSYYVLDWTTETSNGVHGSGDREENVEIDKYNYLEVPQTYIEMDNVPEVAIRYNASHKIGVKWDTDTSNEKTEKGNRWIEALGGTTTLSAFYISNRRVVNNQEVGIPEAVEITNITLKDAEKPDDQETTVVSQFTDNNKGTLTFNYKLGDGIYSPAYVFITIWLDVDGDGVHDTDEILTQDVKIVIYPAIYIIGDKSTQYSVFVNGNYNTNRSSGNNLSYLKIANQQVGKAVGYNTANDEYMSVISVSSFNENNYQFNINGTDYSYSIGDPRVRSSYTLGVNEQNRNPTTPQQDANGWIRATDVNRKERSLEHYYPTSAEEGSFQIIAPKFRISSRLAGYSHCSPNEVAPALRCASYQEDGFPAGRWRLPTTAEILFVINLQQGGHIQELFVGSSNYCSSTHSISNNNGITIRDGFVADSKGTVSVRCVYDDWYWGSEREAIEDPNKVAGNHKFTWGDREVY